MCASKVACLAILPVAALSFNACAAEAGAADAGTYTFSGFGTVGVARTNTDQAQYARVNQLSGASNELDASVDSILGMQLTGKFNNWLSATGQLLSQKGAKNNFVPQVEWAFVKAKLSDEINVRAGRIGLPAYMVSDYRNVGYSNPWLRPPIEVYNLPFSHFDGADMLYQKSFDDVTVTGQALAGVSTSQIVLAGSAVEAETKNVYGINASVEKGPVTLRAGHIRTNLTVKNHPLLNTLLTNINQLPPLLVPGASALANSMRIDGKQASFSGVGMNVDWKNFLFMGEMTRIRSDAQAIPDMDAWYTTFGYRVEKWTPYVTYSTNKVVSPTTDNTIPRIAPGLVYLSDNVNRVLTGYGQSTKSIGVRWDFHQSAALKVQFDRVDPKIGNGLFMNAQPNFTGPVNVISAAVDFVF